MLTFPPDISFLIQIASFVVLWFGLKRLLFDPVLHVLEERERRTSGELRAAEEVRSSAELIGTDYDRRLLEVRARLASEAEATRHEIENEERQILSGARQQASAQLLQLRDSLNRQAGDARAALAPEVQTLARQMFERVVGRPAA